jgi:hypothetical protein
LKSRAFVSLRNELLTGATSFTVLIVTGVSIHAHSVLNVATPRLEIEDQIDASTLLVLAAAARLTLLPTVEVTVSVITSVVTSVLVLLSVTVMDSAGPATMLRVADAVMAETVADAMIVEVLVGASATDVTAGRGNFMVQKLCAGAYEERASKFLYGWLEHAGKLAADAVVARASVAPVEHFIFAMVSGGRGSRLKTGWIGVFGCPLSSRCSGYLIYSHLLKPSVQPSSPESQWHGLDHRRRQYQITSRRVASHCYTVAGHLRTNKL